MKAIHNALGKFIDGMGTVCVLLMILMVLNVFYDVVMRYFFNNVSIGMQELEWHLFAAMFMFGIGYTLKEDAHVRVDIFYEKWLPHTQAKLNILGAVLFGLPISAIIMYYGWGFAMDAYNMQEGSPDPGGLPHRFIIFGVIPASNAFLIICIIHSILTNLLVMQEPNVHHDHVHNEGV